MLDIERRVVRSSNHASAAIAALEAMGVSVGYPTTELSNGWRYRPSVFVAYFDPAVTGCTKMPKIRAFLKELCAKHGLPFATSFGGEHSKLDSFPKLIDGRLRLRFYIGPGVDFCNVVGFVRSLVGRC